VTSIPTDMDDEERMKSVSCCKLTHILKLFCVRFAFIFSTFIPSSRVSCFLFSLSLHACLSERHSQVVALVFRFRLEFFFWVFASHSGYCFATEIILARKCNATRKGSRVQSRKKIFQFALKCKQEDGGGIKK